MKPPRSPSWRARCRPIQLVTAGWLVFVLVACGPAASVPATPSPVPSATPVATVPPATNTADPPSPTATAPPPAPTDTPAPLAATPTLPDVPATLPATASPILPSATPVVPTDTPPPPTGTAPPATNTPRPPATATARPPAATHTLPPATATLRPAVATRTATDKPVVTRTPTPKPVATLTPPPAPTQALVAARPTTAATATGHVYDAYIPAATKQHQDYHYSCEFDAAWVVLKTYGIDSTIDQMISIIGTDTSREPTWEETPKGVFIYGGDVLHYYSGDFKTNFLARTTGSAVRKIFAHYGLTATPVHNQQGIEAALRAGSLVWIKTTADFKPGRPATWVMPDGTSYQTVLGNDHAAVVIGYNKDVAVIRDVLGPTSTNPQRQYEYEVPWPHFLQIWAEQSNDGLAVAPPK